MWPKIHFNRDPRDTLFTELRKEFGTYYHTVGNWGKTLLRSHSRIAFYGMVALLLISLVLSFTLFRNQKNVATVNAKHLSPITDGFGRIMQTTGKIRETLLLKEQVDSLSALQAMSSGDSIRLNAALDRLQQLSKH